MGMSDPLALRSAYLQNRQGQIDEGRGIPALPEIEDSTAPAAPPAEGAIQPDPQTPLVEASRDVVLLAGPAYQPAALDDLPDQ